MLRAKMSSSEAKKARKRKTKKLSKSNTGHSMNTISFDSLPTARPTSTMKNLPDDWRQVLEQVEELPMPPNGIIPNLNLGPLPAVPNFSMTLPTSPTPSPYLGQDTCLLCHRERPDLPGNSKRSDSSHVGQENQNQVTPLPLWVCPDCRKTVEEEERRATVDSNLLEQELRLDSAPTLPIFPDLTGADPASGAQCNCEACLERRQIEAEHVKETQELQQCWMELRHVVRCVYREAGTGFLDNKHLEEGTNPGENQPSMSTLPDVNRMKELVHRLCTRDAHQLYQRLESQGREYVIEMKVRLLKQLTCGHKTPPQAKQFVSMLLEEYSNLCCAAKTLASFLTELTDHLKRFNLTWELHNKHLFQSIIYSDPVVQNSLPMLITQLRLGAASKEAYHEDTYPNILHRYLKFDDEMSVISVVWRDCQQLLDNYNDEQAALKAKQKMLKEDWEFFKAQRKLLEQQVLKNKDVPMSPSSHLSFEAQFTETMRHILTGTKPTADEYTCNNCNRKRCPCDECSISHMITCGIISPEVTEQVPTHHHPSGLYPNDPSRYIIDVTPPSMSSTSSSSGSSSPIAIDPDRLVLPFDDCPEDFDAGEDEIPEEIEGASESDSDSHKNEAMATKEDVYAVCNHAVDKEGGKEKKAENSEHTGDHSTSTAGEYVDEDDDEDDDDNNSATDGEFGDDEEEDDDDDVDESDDDDYASGEDDEEMLRAACLGSSDDDLNSAMAAALRQASLLPELAGPSEGCDCTHCTQAKNSQFFSQANQQFGESSVSQCQCHACLQQVGNISTSLPQHVPSAPRPASLHLYPHIHGANNIAGFNAGGVGHSGFTQQSLQPHLYELHNPLHPVQTNTSTSITTAGTNKCDQSKMSTAQHNNLNLGLDCHGTLHEHIYHAYDDWDNSYDTTKLMLAGHTFDGGLGSELLGAPPPLLTGNPFVQNSAGLGSNLLDGNSLNSSSSSKILQFGPANTTCSMNISSNSGASGTSSCSIAASFSGAAVSSSTAASSSLLNSSVVNHLSAKSDHVHTDACFKNMKTLPASSTGSRMLFNPNQSANQTFKTGGLLGSSAAGASLPLGNAQSTAFSASPLGIGSASAASSVSSLATGVNLPLSEHCLKHNPFLHTHHSSFSGTHTTTTISTSSGLPAHPPPMKLTSELIRSVAMKEGAPSHLSVTSQPVSSHPPPHGPVPTHDSCMHGHGTMGSHHGISRQHNHRSGLLDPNSQAHNQSLKAAMANAFNSSASGLPGAYNNVSTSTGCEAGCDGHHDDQYDSVDDSCSEQSSSTSASNQKDGKYCDCCYCEFFGHSNPPQAPTSRNYAEVRDRLRMRLKQKNDSKIDKCERVIPKPSLRKEDMVDRRGLDELIKFINGAEENMGMGGAAHIEHPKLTGKAASKRLKRRQRKCEEKVLKDRDEMQRKIREEFERKRIAEARMREQQFYQLQQEQIRRQHLEQASKTKVVKKAKHKEVDVNPDSKVNGKSDGSKTKKEVLSNNSAKTNKLQESFVSTTNKTPKQHEPKAVNQLDGKQPNKATSATVKVNPSSSQNNITMSTKATESTKKSGVANSSTPQPKASIQQASNARSAVEPKRKPEGNVARTDTSKQEAATKSSKKGKVTQQSNAQNNFKNSKSQDQNHKTAADHQTTNQPKTTFHNGNDQAKGTANSQPKSSVNPTHGQSKVSGNNTKTQSKGPASTTNSESKGANSKTNGQQKSTHQSSSQPKGTGYVSNDSRVDQSGSSGGGSKLGLNLALQATARALERKRDLLQKQKQQAEQQEGSDQKVQQQTSVEMQVQTVKNKTKKGNNISQPQVQLTPAVQTHQHRQQLLNNMINIHQQSGHEKRHQGMKLPVQKPSMPPQYIVQESRVKQEIHPSDKTRNHQMNGSLTQQHQKAMKMPNGTAIPNIPRTPEKKTNRGSTEAPKSTPVTPAIDETSHQISPRDGNKTYDQARKGQTPKKKTKPQQREDEDDFEKIFKPKEGADPGTGDMDDFERELEEFKRFCWDSASQPPKEKVKLNVNVKQIFTKKGKQGIST